MKHSLRHSWTVLATTVATVTGVSLAIGLLHAAGLPFPPALAVDAWPEWAVFACVVYACTSLCYGAVERVFGLRVTDLGPAT